MIYGVVPVARPRRYFSSCSVVDTRGSEIAVAISGDTRAIERLDWAHQMVTAPSIEGEDVVTRVAEYKGIKFPSTFAVASLDGCKRIWVGRNRNLGKDSDLAPLFAGRRIHIWREYISGTQELVTESRDADSYGQAIIALGAALAGLGVGLIPVAYSAAKANAQRRRARDALTITDSPS